MRHAFRRIVIVALLGCWTLPVQAADSAAQLVVGESSIEELLRLPRNLEPGRYAVHCEASIVASGYARAPYCYTMAQPAPRDLVDAVIWAIQRARFVPAKRAGKLIKVYAVLMVLIDTTLGEPMILAVPNNGVERKRYGLLHTSPQRILEHPDRPMDGRRIFGVPSTELVWMQFQVDDRGGVRDFKLSNPTHVSVRTLRDSELIARKQKFLPGYYEGKAVPMLYVEPIF